MSDTKKYSEMFDYLSAPTAPAEETGVLAFGRKDLLVARKIVDVSKDYFSKFVVISGGVGKDSGDLTEPEAEYLATGVEKISQDTGTVLPPLFTETVSTNGAENVRNSLTLMRRAKLPYKQGITTVAHVTSSRRLTAALEHETALQSDTVKHIYNVPTDYDFDPSNPSDQTEARAEILRLADWPHKGWLQKQPDLPENLVDFARETSK